MKKINNILIIACIAIGIILGVKNIYIKNFAECPVCFSLIPVALLPKLIRRKWNLPEALEFVYLLFVFFAQGLGSALDFYQLWEPYDKVMHFISGTLTAFCGLLVLILLKKHDEKSLLFNTIFIISFVLLIASLWEFFEFACDSIGGGNAQRVLETGVADTMKDMIMATIGAFVFLFLYSYEILQHKNGIIKKCVNGLKM